MTPIDDQPRKPTIASGGPPTLVPVSLGDASVVRELEAYCAALSRGDRPDRRKLLDAYPEIAGDLAECLDGIDLVYQIGPPLEKAELGGASAATESPRLHALGTLGDFRIHREIGRGGMGVVYEAEQVSLGRRVALKVLPFAALLDQRQLARFKNEAHAAASLQHQNIVPVYSVGCERGVHYYAMQYVEGRSLAWVIEHLREEEAVGSMQQAVGSGQKAVGSGESVGWASPTGSQPGSVLPSPRHPRTVSPPHPVTPSLPHPVTPSLDSTEAASAAGTSTPPIAELSTQRSTRRAEYFRSIARLGIQAAEALDHAHARGVIHRDIKPANLLLDVSGNLWVTDFGLARLESDTSMTLTGDLVGTLRYMSPEQALAKRAVVDYRTDIYSLGVTLYELLTLRPAYPGRDREELLRQIAFDEPRRLRALDRAIPGELETVIQKAIEKRPEDRYATAQELADDLKRFLADEPIRARRPTLVVRTAKWSRRHKTLVASAASIAAILLVATTVVALTLAAHEREDARRRLGVQQGINEALAEVARLRGQTPSSTPGDPTALGLAREQLQRALALAETGPAEPEQVANVQQLLTELDQEQKDRQLLAALDRAWLARVDTDVDRFRFVPEASIPILREALAAYGLAVGNGAPEEAAAAIRARPDSIQRELLGALEEWRVVARPLTIGIAWGAPDSPGRIVAIAPESPAARDGRLKIGDQLVGVGEGSHGPLVDTGKMTSAEISAVLSGLRGSHVRLQVIPKGENEPRTYELQRDTTAAWLRAVLEAADPDLWRRRVRDASDLRDPVEIRAALEKLADEADVERQPVRVLGRVGGTLCGLGAEDRGIPLLRRVWQRHPADVGVNLELGLILRRRPEPARLEEAARFCTAAIALRPDSAGLRLALGNVFSAQEKREEAAAQFREALRLEPHYVAALNNLGLELEAQGKAEEAIAEYRKILREQPGWSQARNNFGNLLKRQAKLDEALAQYREVLRLGPNNPLARHNLATALQSQGKIEEAMAELREAVRLNPNDGLCHYTLANLLSDQEKLDDAVAEYREALRLKPDAVPAYVNLGGVYYRQGKLDEAVAAWREVMRLSPKWTLPYNNLASLMCDARDPKWRRPAEALELAKKAVELGPESPNAWNTLGWAHYRSGQWKEAIAALDKAAALRSSGRSSDERARKAGESRPDASAHDWLLLAMAHWQLGNREEARGWYDRAIQWIEKTKPKDEELLRLRAEAEELLGIPEKPRAESGKPKAESGRGKAESGKPKAAS